jgi:uridine kinase
MIASRRSRLVAVVGGSGAGKGWFITRVCELLGDKAGHLQLDDFYHDRSTLPAAKRERINFDAPRAIDWKSAERVLLDCRAGHTTQVPRYDFATHCRMVDHAAWEPRPIVFVDGLWLLRRPDLRRLFDLTVFLDTPSAVRQRRRLARDVLERGYTAEEVNRRFTRDVAPMHARYVEPQKRHADLVLAQPFESDQLTALANRLWQLVESTAPLPQWMRETFRAELSSALQSHETSR